MIKTKMDGWICGLMPEGKREYHLNGVKYIVSARFENPDSENSLRSRFEEAITNEMIDLMEKPPDSKMAEEYVYSAAGKEE